MTMNRDELPADLSPEQVAFLQGWFWAKGVEAPHDQVMLEALEALMDWQAVEEKRLLRT